MDHLSHSLTIPPFLSSFQISKQELTMFDPRTELATHPPSSWSDLSFFPNNRKMVQNHDQSHRINWNSCGGGVQFRLATTEVDSVVCSPPLWSNSSPPRSQNPAQSRSRKEAIAKGQSELMEMVKNMPESCYELSLKDIVERNNHTQLAGGSDQENFSLNSHEEKAISGANNKMGNKINGNVKILRSRSIDQNRGMLLKVGFVPFSFTGSKKKKSCCVRNNKNNTCAKVSPKPEFVDKPFTKNVERKWWKKRTAVSDGSESGRDSSHGGSTGRSGSSGSRDNNSSSSRCYKSSTSGRSNGCWSISVPKKADRQKI